MSLLYQKRVQNYKNFAICANLFCVLIGIDSNICATLVELVDVDVVFLVDGYVVYNNSIYCIKWLILFEVFHLFHHTAEHLRRVLWWISIEHKTNFFS